MSRVVFLLPPLLAMGCEPLDPQRGEVDGSGADSYAILLVDPLKLDFNEVSVNDQGLVVQSFTVENRGTDTIPVRGHDLALATAGSPGAFEVQSEDAVLELGPDERETLQVLFLPTTDASYVASLLIYDGSENDPQRREEVELQLSGVGTAPVLEVRDQAATVVAGVGCRGEQHVRVQNTGSEPLLIEDAVVKESLDFTVASVPT